MDLNIYKFGGICFLIIFIFSLLMNYGVYEFNKSDTTKSDTTKSDFSWIQNTMQAMFTALGSMLMICLPLGFKVFVLKSD